MTASPEVAVETKRETAFAEAPSSRGAREMRVEDGGCGAGSGGDDGCCGGGSKPIEASACEGCCIRLLGARRVDCVGAFVAAWMPKATAAFAVACEYITSHSNCQFCATAGKLNVSPVIV